MNFSKNKSFFASLLLMFVLFLTPSCGDDDGGGSSDLGGSMTCKVDGSDWTAQLGAQAIRSTTVNADILTISGSTNDGSQITLVINDYSGPGTYQITSTLTESSFAQLVEDVTSVCSTTLGQGTGTITIDSEGDTYEGTFSFNCANLASSGSTQITDGEFDAEVME